MIWDSHKSTWAERLRELKAFRALFGHCNVPSRYPPNMQLAIWTKCQRRCVRRPVCSDLFAPSVHFSQVVLISSPSRQYALRRQGKKSNITEERIEVLTDMGFEWTPRNSAKQKPPSISTDAIRRMTDANSVRTMFPGDVVRIANL